MAYVDLSRQNIDTYGLSAYDRLWINQPRPKRYRQRARGQCYYNAQRLAIDNPDLTYVEGFIRSIQHAWVVDQDGRVIETTWPYNPSLHYLGVPFRGEWVAQMMLRHNGYYDLLRHADNQPPEGIVHLDLLARFDAQLSVGLALASTDCRFRRYE